MVQLAANSAKQMSERVSGLAAYLSIRKWKKFPGSSSMPSIWLMGSKRDTRSLFKAVLIKITFLLSCLRGSERFYKQPLSTDFTIVEKDGSKAPELGPDLLTITFLQHMLEELTH